MSASSSSVPEAAKALEFLRVVGRLKVRARAYVDVADNNKEVAD